MFLTSLAVSEKDLLNFLSDLNDSFKSLTNDEFINFIDANPWIIGNLLPVDGRKCVIVPEGTKTTECRLTSNGLNHLINSFGMSTAFEGIPGDSAIKAFAIAAQCRYRTLHIDIDLNVFGHVPASTTAPLELIEWVYRHKDDVLLVRGNRYRLTVFCDLAPDAIAFIQSFERHPNKRIYCFESVKNKIELFYGVVNNTVFGEHPTAGSYQQITPPDNKLVPISRDEIEELFLILESTSYKQAGDSDINAYGERIELTDANHLLFPIRAAMDFRGKMLDAVGQDCTPPKFSIKENLNPKVREIIEGKGFYNGQFYVESDAELPIGAGSRHYTYLNVGSNVNQLVELYETVGIDYDSDEVEEIFSALWQHTDDLEDHEFDIYNARSSFEGYPYILFKDSYLRSLASTIGANILNEARELIPRKTKKLDKQLRYSFAEADIAVKNLSNGNISDNVQRSKLLLEDLDDEEFIEYLNDELESQQLVNDQVIDQFRDRLTKNLNLEEKVFADDWSIVHPIFSDIVDDNQSMFDGLSFPFASTLCAETMPLFGYGKVTNANYDGKIFATYLSPFTLLIGESATGKSRHLELFSSLEYIAKIYNGTLHQQELDSFGEQFLDRKNINFTTPGQMADRDDEINPTDSEGSVDEVAYTPDRVLQLKRLRSQFNKQSVTPQKFLSSRHALFLNQATEAGVRNIFYDNQLATDVKEITGDIATNVYQRPVGIISDELADLFGKIYDPKNPTFSAQYVCARKECQALTTETSTQRSGFAKRAGFTIAGAMTTKDFMNYLVHEIEKSTTGFIPRFNLSIIRPLTEEIVAEEDIRYPTIKDDSFDSKISVILAIYSIILNTVSSDNHLYGDCPQLYKMFHNKIANFDIYSNKQTQLKMYSYYFRAKRWAEELKLQFSGDKFVNFIDSFVNKAYQELAIYAGCTAITYQFLDFTQEIIRRIGKSYDELIAIAFSSKSGDTVSYEFYKLIKSELNTLFLDVENNAKTFEWNRIVKPKHMEVSGKLFMHSLYTLEYLLNKMGNAEVDNINSRANLRMQESIIKRGGDKTYELEKQISKVFEVLQKLSITSAKKKSFTISQQVIRSSRLIQNLSKNNADILDRIFDILISENVLNDGDVNRKGNTLYRFKCDKVADKLKRIKRDFIQTIYEAGNEFSD